VNFRAAHEEAVVDAFADHFVVHRFVKRWPPGAAFEFV